MTITFQNPFEENIRSINYINKEQTIKSFLDINWEQLNIDSYEKHDEAIQDYYFFDIEFTDSLNFKHCLNISGQYTYGNTLINDGPHFYVRYIRPIEKTSRGFLGLGASKTKTVLRELEMEECNKPFVIDCLTAFLNQDTVFLENNIINNITSSF
ncbi:hypothetical protein LZQ00_12245 [Sphingobacterium sp. SRCM116780]|uniref:hypothetical protein n=1 Tax=Sphingobacterium sp. SRCM116780 TaxID=2907623 RepID=UPI001F236265|nr:hypothetical protein [Sphingobacterium sp. SRCM116780]UIR55049.1 hypothetical protein LZQ00_12245 [Sphingobacterium sp. SRCM116780]